MMTLLYGHNLSQVSGRFVPESMSLNLSERQSTATITIGPEAPEIAVGRWIIDDAEPGAGIVWRVKSVETQYDRDTRTVQLEHTIMALKDLVMFGEVTPAMMGGGTDCTAKQAVEYILRNQSDWVLGTFSYTSVSNPYNFNGDDLYSALGTVSSSLEDCWWSYDFSSYPFTLNITTRESVVGTELRMSRNIQTARMTIDKTRMYTRFYPIGKNNLHIDGNCVSKNTEIYGPICKVETDQSISTKEELTRWANERLAVHAQPSVTVTVGALDLSRETGEDLDEIVLGRKCRMPLPGYNTTIEETITKISWQDKIAEPEKATVTLANIQEDLVSIINNLNKSAGGGGGGARKDAANAEEDHAWFLDTTTHVAMIAEACAGEGAAQDWSRVANLVVDGDGIHQRVTQTQQDVVEAYSLIDQTSTAIHSEIGNVRSQVYSFIEQTPEMIHSEVAAGVSGIAHSVIEQTATYIRMEVANAASSISQSVIEQTSSWIRTEVSNVASGIAWSVVTQTMTGIIQEVHRKSKVYAQKSDPNDGTNVLNDGDIWIKQDIDKTWNDNSGSTWDSQSANEWRTKYGDVHYVWRDGAWVKIDDTSTDVENEVVIEQTTTSLAIVGHALDIATQEYNSRLEVTAREIRSETSTASSQIYSTIEQTATSIRSIVADNVNGLQSQIEQTASQIRLEVSSSKSTIWSSITQNADSIELKVSKNGVISAINQTAEAISIQASKINLTGYVTTSDLQATNATIDNLMSGYTNASHIKTASLTVSGIYLGLAGYSASWHSISVGTKITVYTSGGAVTGVDLIKSTIYYLGRT